MNLFVLGNILRKFLEKEGLLEGGVECIKDRIYFGGGVLSIHNDL